MNIEEVKIRLNELESFVYTEKDHTKSTIKNVKEKLQYIRYHVPHVHMKLIRDLLLRTNDEELVVSILKKNDWKNIPSISVFEEAKRKRLLEVEEEKKALNQILEKEKETKRHFVTLCIKNDVLQCVETAMNRWESYLVTVANKVDETILITILEFLPFDDGYSCRLVNRHWARCLSSKTFWKYLTLRKWRPFTRHLTAKYLVSAQYKNVTFKQIYHLMREDVKQLNFASQHDWKNIQLVNSMQSLSESSLIHTYQINMSHAHEFQTNPIHYLLKDTHVLTLIFEFLDFPGLLACRRTCQTFYAILDGNWFWKPLTQHYYPSYLEAHDMHHTTKHYKVIFQEFYNLARKERAGYLLNENLRQLFLSPKIFMNASIWHHISTFLDDISLFALYQTCNTIYGYFQDNDFWHHRVREQFPTSYRRVHQIYRREELTYIHVYSHYAAQQRLVQDWEGLEDMWITYTLPHPTHSHELKTKNKLQCCIIM